MCFRINHKDSTPKIAKRNIVCYKILNNNLVSICYNFPYEIGKTYEPINLNPYQNYGGFSYYIDEGYHSYMKIYSWPTDSVVVKCYIPKGTKYYKNKNDNEYVSSQIKIVARLNN